MAKWEHTFSGEFDRILKTVETEICQKSVSATLEDSSDFQSGSVRCSVRVFERYSFAGKNRVSLNVTLFQAEDGLVHLSAITSGGSQAVLFKVNTLGEEAFLSQLQQILCP